ncbi:MAG: hypothetical protein M0Z70_06605 [Nitrospiraceae bacterium]|jgi:hypothetical protein|nr:hypothetical protein [Nitrospiraceae bacterium]
MNDKKPLERLFGIYYPLVRHFAQTTISYMVILSFIYIARKIVPILFPPGDYLYALLHLVDKLSAVSGIIGYVLWLIYDWITFMRFIIKMISKNNRGGHE